MNWETYKNLTIKQKEEYNFKFKDEIKFSSSGLIISLTNLFLVSVIFIFMIFIIVKDEQFSQYKDSLQIYVNSIGSIFYACGILVVGFAFEYLIKVINRWYSYTKWKRENNIKVIYWWTKWFK